jgi:hypothetical protein
MRNTKFLILIILTFFIFSCFKNKNNSGTNDDLKTIQNLTLYFKDFGGWAYKNEKDLDKDLKIIDKKNKKYFEFGNSFIGITTKKTSKNNIYYNVKQPDNEEYWILKDQLTEKFIIINKNDVSTYNEPNVDFKSTIKLQPGDFGYFIEENGEWVQVDFYAYRPYEKNGQRFWVGKKWINESYSSDLNSAMQAYYLFFAYNFTFNAKNKNKTKAIEYAKKALDLNNGEETDITFVVKNFLNELESGKYF